MQQLTFSLLKFYFDWVPEVWNELTSWRNHLRKFHRTNMS